MAGMDKVVTLLEQDALTNLTLLKMLEAYGKQMDIYFASEDGEQAALLLLPTAACAYDRNTYPDTDYVIFMEYTGQSLPSKLAERIPAGGKAVFKLQRERYARDLASQLPLKRTRGFISYTAPKDAVYECSEEAEIGYTYDDELASLWSANGYEKDELEAYFRGGAFSCCLRAGGEAVSSCLVFPNYRRIWEIGALHTRENWRGRGFARKIVETALHHTMRLGRTPRYHVLETNHASMKLAEAAGLKPFMRLEHYLA